MADWIAIKGEYITTGISQRKLAKKYGMSVSTICTRAKKEGWAEQKRTFSDNLEKKTKEIAEKHEIDRVERLLSLSDQLTDKIQQAIDELDRFLVKDKIKTKTKKQVKNKDGIVEDVEEVKEKETVRTLKAPIDRLGLRQLTAALKDIKEVQIDIGAADEEYDSSGLMEAIKSMGDLLEEDDDSSMLPIEEGEEP